VIVNSYIVIDVNPNQGPQQRDGRAQIEMVLLRAVKKGPAQSTDVSEAAKNLVGAYEKDGIVFSNSGGCLGIYRVDRINIEMGF
jgi:hypothetical protein